MVLWLYRRRTAQKRGLTLSATTDIVSFGLFVTRAQKKTQEGGLCCCDAKSRNKNSFSSTDRDVENKIQPCGNSRKEQKYKHFVSRFKTL